jgi:hypothetical protein
VNQKQIKSKMSSTQEVANNVSVPVLVPEGELSMEIRECGDQVSSTSSESLPPCSPLSYQNELDCDNGFPLIRSQSSSFEPAPVDPVLVPAPVAPSSAPVAPKDPNITRIELGENPDTIALLEFLSSQGIDTTKFVTEHILKYGCFVRVAKTDEGNIVGCVVFGSETELSELKDMSHEEAAKKVGPFIFQHLLVVDTDDVAATSDHWKKRLMASFLKCVDKNGKIAIVRADANDETEIQFYQSCGFFTMNDLDIPSYSSTKGSVEIMAYTPLGREGTAQIFKKFYDMGARF